MWQLFTCESAAVHPSEMSSSTPPPQETNMSSQGWAHGGGQGLTVGPLLRSCGDEETQLSDARHGRTHTHTPISTPWFTHTVVASAQFVALGVQYLYVRQHRGGPAHFPALLQRTHSMIFLPFLRSLFYPNFFYFTTSWTWSGFRKFSHSWSTTALSIGWKSAVSQQLGFHPHAANLILICIKSAIRWIKYNPAAY